MQSCHDCQISLLANEEESIYGRFSVFDSWQILPATEEIVFAEDTDAIWRTLLLNVRIWTPPRLQAICIWQTWHDCIRISGLLSWHTLMPGHNGLFVRQLPIALSYF